jgi:tetratricopeptide (TPR) repeat protein
MGDLWIQVIPRSPADFALLNDDVERKKRTEDIAGYTRILQADPKNPLRHDQVAMLLLSSGQVDQAIGHLRNSLRLNASSAPTHYNLGIALSMQRKLEEALAEFREAIRLDPDHADAHNNAGAILHVMGRLGEATSNYRRAPSCAPTMPTPTATWAACIPPLARIGRRGRTSQSGRPASGSRVRAGGPRLGAGHQGTRVFGNPQEAIGALNERRS